MLEEILSKINTNLERIVKEQEIRNQLLENELSVKQAPSTSIVDKLVQTASKEIEAKPEGVRVPTPAQTAQPVPSVPVTQASESFTYEQIARAMATAMDGGRQDIIQNILIGFNVKSLMEIAPENYNKVATILREAGISL